jgi:transposase
MAISCGRGGIPWNHSHWVIDLGKTTFHLVGMNQREEVVLRKRFFSIAALALYREPEGGPNRHGSLRRSHFLGRALRDLGHEVRLIPAQFVKPYVKTNKSDFPDPETQTRAS